MRKEEDLDDFCCMVAQDDRLKRIYLFNRDLQPSERIFPDSVSASVRNVLKVFGGMGGVVSMPMYTSLWYRTVAPWFQLYADKSDTSTSRSSLISDAILVNLLAAMLVTKMTSLSQSFGHVVPDSPLHGFNWKDPWEYARAGTKVPLLALAAAAGFIEPAITLTYAKGNPVVVGSITACGWAANTAEFYITGKEIMSELTEWWIRHANWALLPLTHLRGKLFASDTLLEQEAALRIRRELLKDWEETLQQISDLRIGMKSSNRQERDHAAQKLQALWELSTVKAKNVREAKEIYLRQCTYFDACEEQEEIVMETGEDKPTYIPPKLEEEEEEAHRADGLGAETLNMPRQTVVDPLSFWGMTKKWGKNISVNAIPPLVAGTTFAAQTTLAFFTFHEVFYGPGFGAGHSCTQWQEPALLSACAEELVSPEIILPGIVALSASSFKAASEWYSRRKLLARYTDALTSTQTEIRQNNDGTMARGMAQAFAEIEGPIMVLPLAIELVKILGIESASDLLDADKMGTNVAKMLFASTLFPGASGVPADEIGESYETVIKSLRGIIHKARLHGCFTHCGQHNNKELEDARITILSAFSQDANTGMEVLLDVGNNKECVACKAWEWKLDQLIAFQESRMEALKRYSTKELLALYAELSQFREGIQHMTDL